VLKCQLCLKEKQAEEICNSHLLPEFAFSLAYDEKHRVVAISEDKKQKTEILQKGVREKLLCKDCESVVSEWEGTLSIVLRSIREQVNKKGITVAPRRIGGADCWVVSGIDYNNFKLGVLSIIWRFSISRLDRFREYSLGPHQKRIRKILLQGNAGNKLDYGIQMYELMHGGKVLDDLIIVPPDEIKVFGHNCSRFAFGGFFFVVFISKHDIPEKHQLLMLEGGVDFIVVKQEIGEAELFTVLSKNIYSRDDYERYGNILKGNFKDK